MIAIVRNGVCDGFIAGLTPDGSGGWVGGDGRPWTPPPALGVVELVDGEGARIGYLRTSDGWVAPHLASLDAARAWALEQVGSPPTTARLPDGVLYDLSERAQTNWASLWNAHRLAVEVGSSAFPTTFYAADGTEVELDTYEEARGLYLTLFAAGAALRRGHLAKVAAIEDAATVEDVVAVLEGR